MYPILMQSELFDSAFFTQNRQKLQEKVGSSQLIVLTGNGRVQRSNDTTYPFRQDSTFWYLTGINEPNCTLVMKGEECYIITPSVSEQHVVFDGAIDTETVRQTAGIHDIHTEAEGWKRLRATLALASSVATCAPSTQYQQEAGYFVNPARKRLVSRLKARNSRTTIKDIRSDIMQLRLVKQPSEVAAIERAAHITSQTLNDLYKAGIAQYEHEFEIAAQITHGFMSRNATHAYEPIVASAKNACTLHYTQNNQPLQQDAYLLIDAGAEVSNYASDVTRTYAVGEPPKQKKDIYDAVVAAHSYGLSLIQPGRTLQQNESDMLTFLGKALKQLGYINKATPEAIRAYYPHGLTHFVGLDVHDVGDYQRPLEAGMVITVEPGLYIPDEAAGVRVEDTVLVTENGMQNLTETCRIPV